ncbi:DUF707 domain-containing protein [Rhizobium sp. SSA_523]|uniref:DUF707 domain-containing protein n=1 Tax=Rhizobium sp. SSA_523 TaxID=2952477 RepID=UPI0020918059|nr:DUF707 domain-containing protein [Rhizobium sp. SSA_523]MCO5733009.1 DUF707 domain-containing protein [Rhizobium sp. SSA_523]WKC23890.1 DUF707 domain-containing protein [Rhizobium sp. SSA_523]
MNMFASDNSALTSVDWGTAPPVTQAALEGSFWQLSSLDAGPLAPFLVLAPGGRIGNFFDQGADYWHVFQDHLCFVDAQGALSVIFNAAQMRDGTLLGLAGRGTINGIAGVFMLSCTQHPAHPVNATPPGVERRAHFLVEPSKPLRPNLVVVPANAQTLHGHWLENLPDTKRTWDLCVGFYGEERPFLPAPAEYLAHLPRRRKFMLLADLFYEGSPLWEYERIWLPDDDLMVSGHAINLMFHQSRKHGLDLCQPAMSDEPGSHPNHPLTVRRTSGGVRHERFVEIMCPLFSRRALRICIGSFKDSVSGYGLDHLWPSFLGRPLERMAILDDIGVVHTRPIGATYNIGAAIGEQQALFGVYGYRFEPVPGVR